MVLGAALFAIMGRTTKIFDKVFRKYDDLNASVQENVSAIRVVKAFVREAYENEKFQKAADELYRLFVKAEGLLALNNPVMMLVVYGSILGLSWFGAHFIVAGTLTTGELTSLLSYVMGVLMSLMMLSMVFVMITMSAASAERIAEVLTETPDLAQPENPDRSIPNGSVDFDHVSFSYKHGSGEKTLHDITLHIRSAKRSASSAARAAASRALSTSSAACTTPTPGAYAWAARTCAATTWKRCAARWPGAAKKRAVLGHDFGQPALGQGGRHAGGVPRRL